MAPRISENDAVFDPSRHCIATDPTLPSILPMNFKRDEHIAADPLGVLEAGLEGVKNAYINNTFLDPDSTTRRKNDEDLNTVRRRVEQFMETFIATHPQHRRPHWRFWQAKVVYLLDDDDVAAVAKHYKGCEEAYFQVTRSLNLEAPSVIFRHPLLAVPAHLPPDNGSSTVTHRSKPRPMEDAPSTTGLHDPAAAPPYDSIEQQHSRPAPTWRRPAQVNDKLRLRMAKKDTMLHDVDSGRRLARRYSSCELISSRFIIPTPVLTITNSEDCSETSTLLSGHMPNPWETLTDDEYAHFTDDGRDAVPSASSTSCESDRDSLPKYERGIHEPAQEPHDLHSEDDEPVGPTEPARPVSMASSILPIPGAWPTTRRRAISLCPSAAPTHNIKRVVCEDGEDKRMTKPSLPSPLNPAVGRVISRPRPLGSASGRNKPLPHSPSGSGVFH